MEKENIFNWLKRIIDTSNNDFHFESIDKLIELFHEKFNDNTLKTELELLRVQRWNDIHSILK